MKTKYYQIRYIDMMGKDKTANISAKSEAGAVKKFKAKPIFLGCNYISNSHRLTNNQKHYYYAKRL